MLFINSFLVMILFICGKVCFIFFEHMLLEKILLAHFVAFQSTILTHLKKIRSYQNILFDHQIIFSDDRYYNRNWNSNLLSKQITFRQRLDLFHQYPKLDNHIELLLGDKTGALEVFGALELVFEERQLIVKN